MRIVRLGVVALVAAAAILGFRKVRQSRRSETLTPMPDTDQGETAERSWPMGARS